MIKKTFYAKGVDFYDTLYIHCLHTTHPHDHVNLPFQIKCLQFLLQVFFTMTKYKISHKV